MMFTFFFLCWSTVAVQHYVSFRCAIWWLTISKSYTPSTVTVKYYVIFPVPSIPGGQPCFIWTLPVLHAPNLFLVDVTLLGLRSPLASADTFSLSPTCIALPICSVCRILIFYRILQAHGELEEKLNLSVLVSKPLTEVKFEIYVLTGIVLCSFCPSWFSFL